MPKFNIKIIMTPYLSVKWLGVDLRMDTKNTCIKKRFGLSAQKLLTILGSIVNVVGVTSMPILRAQESSLW
jgi:hypothetical protein